MVNSIDLDGLKLAAIEEGLLDEISEEPSVQKIFTASKRRAEKLSLDLSHNKNTQASEFFLPVEAFCYNNEKIPTIIGRIEKGSVMTGENIDISGMGNPKLSATVVGIKMFGRTIKVPRAGNKVEIALSCGSERSIIEGMTASSPGSLKMFRQFQAQITIHTKDEGGEIIRNGNSPCFTFRTETLPGKIQFKHQLRRAQPGETFIASIILSNGAPLNPGMPFYVTNGRREIATGCIIKISSLETNSNFRPTSPSSVTSATFATAETWPSNVNDYSETSEMLSKDISVQAIQKKMGALLNGIQNLKQAQPHHKEVRLHMARISNQIDFLTNHVDLLYEHYV